MLHSPAGLDASFTPTAPGRYVYRLSDAAAARPDFATSEVEVLEPNHLVPVETMIGSSDPGIRVGRYTYPLSKAEGPSHGGLQVLVLERETLQCVADGRFAKAAEAEAALKGLRASDLVIVSQQPGAAADTDAKGIYDALGSIGFPTEAGGTLPTAPGSFSGIGVPGMSRGDANVNIVADGSGEEAGLHGYLAPDEYANYGFIPSLSQSVRYLTPEGKSCPTSLAECEAHSGYTLRVQNPRTGATVSEELFTTAGENGTERAAALLAEPRDRRDAGIHLGARRGAVRRDPEADVRARRRQRRSGRRWPGDVAGRIHGDGQALVTLESCRRRHQRRMRLERPLTLPVPSSPAPVAWPAGRSA